MSKLRRSQPKFSLLWTPQIFNNHLFSSRVWTTFNKFYILQTNLEEWEMNKTQICYAEYRMTCLHYWLKLKCDDLVARYIHIQSYSFTLSQSCISSIDCYKPLPSSCYIPIFVWTECFLLFEVCYIDILWRSKAQLNGYSTSQFRSFCLSLLIKLWIMEYCLFCSGFITICWHGGCTYRREYCVNIYPQKCHGESCFLTKFS